MMVKNEKVDSLFRTVSDVTEKAFFDAIFKVRGSVKVEGGRGLACQECEGVDLEVNSPR